MAGVSPSTGPECGEWSKFLDAARDAHERVLDLADSIGYSLLPVFCRTVGPRADGRRRPRRIQRKLDKRGGYRKHNCLGAILHSRGLS